MLKNWYRIGPAWSILFGTLGGAIAGAIHGEMLFRLPGLSDPPMNHAVVVVLNSIVDGLVAFFASALATALGVVAKRTVLRLWLEIPVVFFAAAGALCCAGYLTWAFPAGPDPVVLATFAGLVSLTYFGATRICDHFAARQATAAPEPVRQSESDAG